MRISVPQSNGYAPQDDAAVSRLATQVAATSPGVRCRVATALVAMSALALVAVPVQAEVETRVVNPRDVEILQALLGVEPLTDEATASPTPVGETSTDPTAMELARANEAAEKALAVEKAKAAAQSVLAAKKAKAAKQRETRTETTPMAKVEAKPESQPEVEILQVQAPTQAPAQAEPQARPEAGLQAKPAPEKSVSAAPIAPPTVSDAVPMKNAAVQRVPTEPAETKGPSRPPKSDQAAPFGGLVGLS